MTASRSGFWPFGPKVLKGLKFDTAFGAKVVVGGFMDTPFGREGSKDSKGSEVVRQFGVYSIVR